MFEGEILTLAQSVLDACRARNWRLATAESSTGGLVAAALTAPWAAMIWGEIPSNSDFASFE